MKPTWQPADAVLWAALLVPFATKLPLATTSVLQAYVQTPMILWLWLLQGVVSLWLLQQDRWLGLWACWWTLSWLWHPTTRAYEGIETLVLGSLCLWLVQQLRPQAWWAARIMLLSLGIIQILWQTTQWVGWDWTWTDGFGPFTELSKPAGTYGNAKYLGVVLGILAPLSPLWLVPIFVWGLFLSKSVLGMLAAVIGLAVQWPRWRWGILATGAVALALAVARHTLYAFGWSWHARLDVWTTALSMLTPLGWLIGRGPGSWMLDYQRFPVSHTTQIEGYFVWAHNDVLQIVWEGGLVALVCLGGWLWSNRQRVMASPWRGGAAALMIISLGFSPWHLVTTGLVALVVLGGATAKESTQ